MIKEDAISFTYDSYENLLAMLIFEGYEFSSYLDWSTKSKSVILRHDIDQSIEKALEIAEIERKTGGGNKMIKSTFFVLLSSDFYNVFSKKNTILLREIQQMGHEIGLHFDEAKYGSNLSNDSIIGEILKEARILGDSIQTDIRVVSMHRPSKGLIDSDVAIPGMINSYSKKYFSDFKYVSDSRMKWREPVTSIIKSGIYDRLHILTHPFWYNDTEKDIEEICTSFINDGKKERYRAFCDNVRDFNEIVADNVYE